MKLVLATANPDKAAEIRAVLVDAGLDVELVPRPAEVPEVDETGTFDHRELRELLRLARRGVRRIVARHRRLMGDSGLLPEIVRAE